MGVGFGHGSFVGFGSESTYGTGVAATKFLELLEEDLKLSQTRIPKKTLTRVSQRYSTKSKRAAEGSFKVFFPFQGMELLLKHVFGGGSSAQIGSTGVYTHTFAFTDALLTGLSILIDKDSTALGYAFRHTGCQIQKLTLTQEVEDFLTATFEVVGRDVLKVSAETPTFPTFVGVDWEHPGASGITLDGTPFAGRMLEFSIENPIADDRYKIGSPLKLGGGRKDVRKVTGKFSLEFGDFAAYDKFDAKTTCALVATWTGPIAAGSTPYDLAISVPNAFLQTGAAPVKDHGPINVEYTFEALYDTSAGKEIGLAVSNLLTAIPS